MRPSRVRACWRDRRPAFLTQLHLTDPSVFELASLSGYDGIWMDLEHHAYSTETAGGLMRAARAGGPCDILARPAKGEFMRMGRLLEAGAHGILYPRLTDAAEAAEVVRWAKFPPLGERGFDGGNPDMPYCRGSIPEYVRRANEETFVVVQIEDARALDQVEAIAAVDGVDAVFFGPADFSISCGIPGEFGHELVADASRRIERATRDAGKEWGMPCFSPEHLRELIARGARLIPRGADIVAVKAQLEAFKADFDAALAE